ncbi:TPA: T9SS type A sorting domain-containing protein [Candidatus Poribacteria bacterium]|nr:T9SS type A sorting domain-containing protein [Candidatus Poribacteria bacterium]
MFQVREYSNLLQNYPNPFNPETWIPYDLANSVNVKITIYDANGSVVRTLEVGNLSAGSYISRGQSSD